MSEDSEAEIERLHLKLAEWKASSNGYERKYRLALNRQRELEAENAELRRTHQGGQTGAEVAELQTKLNDALRQLGEERQEYLTFRRKMEPKF